MVLPPTVALGLRLLLVLLWSVCLPAPAISAASDHMLKLSHALQSSSFVRRGEAAVGHDKLECGMRLAAFKFAPTLPRDPIVLYDALEIKTRCDGMSLDEVMSMRRNGKASGKKKSYDPFTLRGTNAKDANAATATAQKRRENANECHDFYIGDASLPDTYPTLHDAVDAARLLPPSTRCKRIKLPPGVTYLNDTLKLGRRDSHLTIQGADDGSSWISGGIPLLVSKQDVASSELIGGGIRYEIPITDPKIKEVSGLFRLDPHLRYQRARWPNADTERALWRGDEADMLKGSGLNDGGKVREWLKPETMEGEEFVYIDLTDPSNPTGHVKDDTTMTAYNTYVSGKGGMCDVIWDTSYSSSYWCADRSAGGWAEVDNEFAKAGTVGLPVGLSYYKDDDVGQHIERWANATNAIVHARHSQSWFSNMWEVITHNKSSGVLHFGQGGSQGGRSWCRCDQCTYAGPWCKRDNDGKVIDDRLIGGGWYVENVLEELDNPGEFFYVESNRTILLLLNSTEDTDMVLVVPKLATLIDIDGADFVTISNVGFRDARKTYLEKHGVPSGGDWSLYKGAAFQIANSLKTTVKGCTFSRLDGSAIILTERTRQITIEECEFEWLGESAVAAWGRTDEWDGRDGRQPRDTLIRRNVVREIGIYEKQSSAWFQAKSCNNRLVDNIFFNMPRAAININDGFGGGNVIMNNLLFNTCRESGDHGPINTWDRQPFLWDATGQYGFNTPPHIVSKNFLVANYGASQGIDNDDGSSFYHITDNIMLGEGLKADYGGHDSVFSDNLVIVSPYDGQNCINVNFFKVGHQHKFIDNVCAVLSCSRRDCDDLIGYTYDSCRHIETFPLLANNTYYTKNGNASLNCANDIFAIDVLQKRFNNKIEAGSSSHVLPNDDVIARWLFDKITLMKGRNEGIANLVV